MMKVFIKKIEKKVLMIKLLLVKKTQNLDNNLVRFLILFIMVKEFLTSLKKI